MQVLSAQTGGLADVTGALPKALSSYGIDTRTIMPGYAGTLEKLVDVRHEADVDLLGEAAKFYSGRHEGIDVITVDCPPLFHRDGGPYLPGGRGLQRQLETLCRPVVCDGPDRRKWPRRLAAGHRTSASLAKRACGCVLEGIGASVPVVLSIHNLAFQGQFSPEIFGELQLPGEFFSTEKLDGPSAAAPPIVPNWKSASGWREEVGRSCQWSVA
ncbi:glycogen/starch synthase [Pararhizobium sp. BT-229]|uniref:glycogen/starch synthase n=1 Tax=Pararhizobium sp. BT-229 TaxID=2986923 RepID=UPI003555DF1A